MLPDLKVSVQGIALRRVGDEMNTLRTSGQRRRRAEMQKGPFWAERAFVRPRLLARCCDELEAPYLGGAEVGVKPSRLRAGSGFGFGLGAFLTSFLPLSLLPMGPSVTQNGSLGEDEKDGSPLRPASRCLNGFNRTGHGAVACPRLASAVRFRRRSRWRRSRRSTRTPLPRAGGSRQ